MQGFSFFVDYDTHVEDLTTKTESLHKEMTWMSLASDVGIRHAILRP